MLAVILCGGLGTRLRSVVSDVPKPMGLVNGRPFLEHQMNYCIDQGVTSFMLLTGYMGFVIEDYFGSEYRGISVDYGVEDIPLGTGGALLQAIKYIDSDFFLLNGDTYFEIAFDKLRRYHYSKSSKMTFALCRSDNPSRYDGISMDSSGKILSISGESNYLSGMANGGVYFCDHSSFKTERYDGNKFSSLETDLIPQMMLDGLSMYGLQFDSKFIDIGIPRDFLRAGRFLDV